MRRRLHQGQKSSHLIQRPEQGSSALRWRLQVRRVQVVLIANPVRATLCSSALSSASTSEDQVFGEDFGITVQTLAELKAAQIPADVLTKLKTLQSRSFGAGDEFLQAIRAAIGSEQAERFKPLFLTKARTGLAFKGFQTRCTRRAKCKSKDMVPAPNQRLTA